MTAQADREPAPSEALDPAASLDLGAFDATVHHPVRLGILTVLGAVDQATFSYLKRTLAVTDGNLSRNVTVLEQAGFVEVVKGYEGKRPRTWVRATPAGRDALAAELAALRAMAAWQPPGDDAA